MRSWNLELRLCDLMQWDDAVGLLTYDPLWAIFHYRLAADEHPMMNISIMITTYTTNIELFDIQVEGKTTL